MANLDSEELQKRLLKALKIGGDTYTPADLAEAVKEGRMQAWQSGQSVVITEVIGYPQKRALNVFIAVGDLEEVMKLQPTLEKFGQEHGCYCIRMSGRKGWTKVLPNYGWKQTYVTFERNLP